MTSREIYIEKMKSQLDVLDAKMTRAETKAAEAKADARDKYKEEMGKLQHQSKLASAKLEEMKLAGEDTWEKMKIDMETMRDAFTHSFHYFKSQI
jgi:hypothetical protein